MSPHLDTILKRIEELKQLNAKYGLTEVETFALLADLEKAVRALAKVRAVKTGKGDCLYCSYDGYLEMNHSTKCLAIIQNQALKEIAGRE